MGVCFVMSVVIYAGLYLGVMIWDATSDMGRGMCARAQGVTSTAKEGRWRVGARFFTNNNNKKTSGNVAAKISLCSICLRNVGL